MADNLSSKKERIIECVRSGLPYDRALILCEINDKQLEKLKNDTAFQRRIKIIDVMEEQRLINQHNAANEQAIKQGISRGIEWRLSKINPKHWGDEKAGSDSAVINIIISEEDQDLV